VKTIDPSALARIEVIKGATSVYGNGASGGIINYITKQATAQDTHEGQVSLSSRFSAVKLEESAGARISAAINGKVENFDYLVTASYEENGVQRDAEGDILGLQYGLSDAETQNYFTKLGYDFIKRNAFNLATTTLALNKKLIWEMFPETSTKVLKPTLFTYLKRCKNAGNLRGLTEMRTSP